MFLNTFYVIIRKTVNKICEIYFFGFFIWFSFFSLLLRFKFSFLDSFSVFFFARAFFLSIFALLASFLLFYLFFLLYSFKLIFFLLRLICFLLLIFFLFLLLLFNCIFSTLNLRLWRLIEFITGQDYRMLASSFSRIKPALVRVRKRHQMLKMWKNLVSLTEFSCAKFCPSYFNWTT